MRKNKGKRLNKVNISDPQSCDIPWLLLLIDKRNTYYLDKERFKNLNYRMRRVFTKFVSKR